MMLASDFIAFAAKLAAQNALGPAAYRTAVGRAYYGAFHAANVFLEERFGFRCRVRDNVHLWVQRHFLNCTFHEAHEIGTILSNLHESRKRADYDLKPSIVDTQVHAQFCVVRATEIQSSLQVCGGSNVLATIQAEMTEYRKRAGLS
jgi:uncharacterized protein (UPF0332 family)